MGRSSGGARDDHGVYCIRNMHGVTVAADCLVRYTRRHHSAKSSSAALNMLGVLLERENLLRTSAQVLTASLQHTENEAAENRDKILMNLGRVSLKMKDYGKAKEAYSAVRQLDLYGQLGLALSHERLGEIEKAYDSYRVAFEKSEGGSHAQSQILTAMGAIAYRVHGADAAKTLLLKSSQLRPVSVNALMALCVLGLKKSDPQLMGAALQEMDKYQRDNPNGDLEHQLPDIMGLKALVHVLRGDQGAARRVLASAVHAYPHLSRLWSKLGLHLLEFERGGGQSAAGCFKRAAALIRSRGQGCSRDRQEVSVMEQRREDQERGVQLSCLAALSSIADGGDAAKAVKAASKAVHDHPDSAKTWSVLAAALALRADQTNDQALLRTKTLQCAQVVLGGDDDDKRLSAWLHQELTSQS